MSENARTIWRNGFVYQRIGTKAGQVVFQKMATGGMLNGRIQLLKPSPFLRAALFILKTAGVTGLGLDAFLSADDLSGVGVADNVVISPLMIGVMGVLTIAMITGASYAQRPPGAVRQSWRQCWQDYRSNPAERDHVGPVRRLLLKCMRARSTVSLLVLAQTFLMGDDVTGVGVADNAAQFPVGVLLLASFALIFSKLAKYRWRVPVR